MAGLYADIPGTRFALDQDGSVLKYRNYTTSSAWTDASASLSEVDKVNTANYLSMSFCQNSNYNQFALAFPEARTIAGIYIHAALDNGGYNLANLTWEYSTNTTDGTDGTWSPFTVTFGSFAQHDNNSENSRPYYRSDIATVSLSAVTGIRMRANNTGFSGDTATHRLFVLHIYGTRPAVGVDRLAFWHPSADQAIGVADLDFGDIAQGTSVTRQLRIKNLSGTLTANNITLQVSDLLSEYSGGSLEVSIDNTIYQSSVNIGNLAPGTISSTLYVRRTVGGAESTTQRHARLLTNAASWV